MDLNVQAYRLVQESVSESLSIVAKEKSAASRKGGLKGGRARAAALSNERRSEIAKQASTARWVKSETSTAH